MACAGLEALVGMNVVALAGEEGSLGCDVRPEAAESPSLTIQRERKGGTRSAQSAQAAGAKLFSPDTSSNPRTVTCVVRAPLRRRSC